MLRWHMVGQRNDGFVDQDNDGWRDISRPLNAATRAQAIREFSRELDSFLALDKEGTPKNRVIDVRLEDNGRVIKQVQLRYEEVVVENVETRRRGRGWVKPKDWINQRQQTRRGRAVRTYTRRSQTTNVY